MTISIPERFIQNNAWVCFLLGYTFNGILLWLIAVRTTKEMAGYRPILLLTICTDLIFLAAIVLVVPVVVSQGGYAIWASLGPLCWLPQPYNFLLIALYMFFCMFTATSMAVPFLYRYLCICRGKEYGLREFLTMLISPIVMAAIAAWLMAYDGYVATEEAQQEARQRFFNESEAYAQRVIPYSRDPRNMLFPSVALAFLVPTYALIFTCGWHIYHQLTRRIVDHVNSEVYRALNLQLSSALLLQALIPLVMVFAPAVGILVATMVGLNVGKNNPTVYFTSFMEWNLVLNPLIIIWVIRAYRRGVIDCWRWLKATMLGRRRMSATVKPAQFNREQRTIAITRLAG